MMVVVLLVVHWLYVHLYNKWYSCSARSASVTVVETVVNDDLRVDKKTGAQKNAMQFMLAGMNNGENKVPMFGSGPLGGSSWRSGVEEKLYIWSLQSGGCGGPKWNEIVSTENIHVVTDL